MGVGIMVDILVYWVNIVFEKKLIKICLCLFLGNKYFCLSIGSIGMDVLVLKVFDLVYNFCR